MSPDPLSVARARPANAAWSASPSARWLAGLAVAGMVVLGGRPLSATLAWLQSSRGETLAHYQQSNDQAVAPASCHEERCTFVARDARQADGAALSTLRAGGVSSGEFVWVPASALSTARDGGLQVWQIFGTFAVPVRVQAGLRRGDEVAVLERPVAALGVAVDPDDWSALTVAQRREVLRRVGLRPSNLHLRAGLPVIAAGHAGLVAGAPARAREGR